MESQPEKCAAVAPTSRVKCDLPEGHDGDHEHRFGSEMWWWPSETMTIVPPRSDLPFVTDDHILKQLRQIEHSLLAIHVMAGSAARRAREFRRQLEPREAPAT